MRVALLGLALVLSIVAGLGVAGLYSARQGYEDRLADGYALQASPGPLLAPRGGAGGRAAPPGGGAEGPKATPQAALARRAFAAELAHARTLARGDTRSEQLVA